MNNERYKHCNTNKQVSHIKPIKDKSPNYGGVKNTGLSPEGVVSEVVSVGSPPRGSGIRGCKCCSIV